MRKTFHDIKTDSTMVGEPVATYNVSNRHIPSSKELAGRNSVNAKTVSVDEYFDELISLVQEDYASL